MSAPNTLAGESGSPHGEPSSVSRERLADEELLLLREATRLLGKSLDPGVVIREILHLLSELLGLNRGRVALPDDGKRTLSIRHAYGLTASEIARGRYGFGEGVTGKVMVSGEPHIVQDIDAESGYLGRAVERATLPQETVAFIAVPISDERGVCGVLAVHRLRGRKRAFSDDMMVLRTVATLIGQLLQLQRLVAERTARLENENRALKQALETNFAQASSLGIVGTAPQLTRALRQLGQVAGTDASVLLLGESGTGKELFARALHLQSARKEAPFVKLNCAAIPESLFESELFGHEKGAFTGAGGARAGRFEQAQGGTLFLDEIGDMPLSMQVKLLRALQERVIERLGSGTEIRIDVRIVTATHQDLQLLVSQGRFRLDLLYRLNVIPITLPPLRERREDIRLLTRHFLSQLNQHYQRNVTIAGSALESLVEYDWPGNIRQLYNVLERLVLLADSEQIEVEPVATTLASERGTELRGSSSAPTVRAYQRVESADRQRLEQALLHAGGNKSRAAQMLGLTLRQFNYRYKVLGLRD